MNVDRNKALAREFFAALSRGDTRWVLDFYSDDGTCWTAGSLPISGERSREELEPFMAGILDAFPEGLAFEIEGMTAEGDRVAVEAESRGRHVSGKIYNNHYHFLMVIRDGKLHRFKEYLDTQLANEVLVLSTP